MRASGRARGAVTVGLGCLLGIAPFLLETLEPLTYLIPLSLRGGLRATSMLLGGFIAFVVRGGEPLGRYRRGFLRTWAVLAPVGLVLLFVFQDRFIVRVPHSNSTGFASEVIVLQPRLKTCPPGCAPMSDRDCVDHHLSLRASDLELCWDGALRWRNQSAWAVAYLLLVGGACSFVGLIWGSVGRARAARPATGVSYDLFLSYSRQDRDLAERLAGDLKARGFAIWWDSWEMEIGDSLPRRIEEAVSRSARFGIILSPAAVASPWVRAELDLALTMEIEGGLTILPILHRPCELPLSLRGKVWADFTASYQEGLDSLLRGFRADRLEPMLQP